MTKIGRNEPCLCGSGKKYKKCCLLQEQELLAKPQSAEEQLDEPKTVCAAVETIKMAALQKQQVVLISGVLILFSSREGDAWLLELTESDALQLTAHGSELAVLIDENPENTLIEWTHTFSFQDNKFVVQAYKDHALTVHEGYPVKEIIDAMEAIRRLMPPGFAGMVHLPLEVRDEDDAS